MNTETGPDFGYEVDDRLNQRTMVVFAPRTARARNWVDEADANGLVGVAGEVTNGCLRVHPFETRTFLTAFNAAGLTVEGFGGTPARRDRPARGPRPDAAPGQPGSP